MSIAFTARTPGHRNRMAYDLRDAHVRDPATIVRGADVAGRLPAAGRLDLASSMTHRFALEEIDAAFATAVAKPPGFVEAVVAPSARATSSVAPGTGVVR